LEEGAQILMHVCRNWGTEVCNRDVSKWISMEGMRDNEGVIVRPIKEEVDEICSNCEARKVK